jgi:spore coat polysaccharide biosynthesis predicted glycosyltransferase SpsG
MEINAADRFGCTLAVVILLAEPTLFIPTDENQTEKSQTLAYKFAIKHASLECVFDCLRRIH